MPAPAASRRSGRGATKPFAGVIDAVMVHDPVPFPFPGSVSRAHAEAAWTWVYRDLCPDLISADGVANGNFSASDFEVVVPEVLKRMKAALAVVAQDQEKDRRLRAALGSVEAREALPTIMAALRSRALLAKARAFGKAVNTITDEGALGVALQSMPLQDPPLAALVFHAATGQVANPTRLTTTVIRLSGNATEAAVIRIGFGPLVDAILAHAQNQLHILQPMGPFADIDLVCRSLDRFHRLVRSLTGYIEFTRNSRWATALSAITKQVSDRIEPRLRDVVSDVNQAMRRGREGADRLDNDRLLAAINGVYLLAAIRECRDSLALNALFEQAWSQTGQALEVHLQRNLDLIRQFPADPVIGARLDAGIKMAEVRFNSEYAETLRRARAAAERRS
ncbi:MAG TPA: hypothetical protein VGN60_04000 [Devosia sp.]|nr:hypothetical protein [Devosia sp.]